MTKPKCCVEGCNETATLLAWDNELYYPDTYNYYCDNCISVAFHREDDEGETTYSVQRLKDDYGEDNV